MNNNQKLREALENSSGLLKDLAPFGEWYESAWEQVKENSAALAAPPRNCDIGTVEEQGARAMETFSEWRNRFSGMKLINAVMAWAQMPYKKGGAE